MKKLDFRSFFLSRVYKNIVHGEDIMVKFTALPSAQILDSKASNSKVPNRHNGGLDVGLEDGLKKEIIQMFLVNPQITMAEIAEKLNVTKRTILQTAIDFPIY